jgi:2'-5' RNA ligase
MEVKGDVLPGYKVCEYMIVLNPHQELANKITEVRKAFNKEYKIDVPTATKANLALVMFKQYELMEDRIVSHLRTIALGFPPFMVELKDFGSFPSHTIFINVTSKLPVQKLIKEIRSETQRLMKLNDDNKPYFNLEPHITLGRKLAPWQYESGWLKYSHKSFTGRFVADSMLLLKRTVGTKPWQILNSFVLNNLPVHTKQGELFG